MIVPHGDTELSAIGWYLRLTRIVGSGGARWHTIVLQWDRVGRVIVLRSWNGTQLARNRAAVSERFRGIVLWRSMCDGGKSQDAGSLADPRRILEEGREPESKRGHFQ